MVNVSAFAEFRLLSRMTPACEKRQVAKSPIASRQSKHALGARRMSLLIPAGVQRNELPATYTHLKNRCQRPSGKAVAA